MEKNNSFPLKLFLEQWLPRLIALGIVGYLVYSLIFRQDDFSWLHIIALLIVTALILAPMARRLKVFNLIDFNSKLDGLKQEQKETNTQLNELRNQIFSVTSTHVSPIQVTSLSLEGIQQLISTVHEGKNQLASEGHKYTKVEFLRKANGYRNRAYPLLLLTRSFQIAINEHRLSLSDPTVTKQQTLNEAIKNLVNTILEHDLQKALPIDVTDKNSEETHPIITPEVTEGLRQINSLIDLYQRIETGEDELPSTPYIDDLFSKVLNTLATIGAAIDVIASNSILDHYKIISLIKKLQVEINKSDTEQRPISFPPANSD